MSTIHRPNVGQTLPRPAPMVGPTHTVAKGDTLSGIAAQHGVSLDTLKELNPQLKSTNFDLIRPGEHVHLPSGAGIGASTPPATVKQSPAGAGDRFESGGAAQARKVTGETGARPTAEAAPAEVVKAGVLAMRGRTGQATGNAPTNHVVGFGKGLVDAGTEAAQGLWTMAKGAVNLTGLRGSDKQAETLETVKSVGQALTTKEGLKAFGTAVAEPFTTAWKEGKYGEVAGRATFEALGVLVGTKGLDKLAKGGKAGGVASKADDLGRAASKTDDVVKAAPAATKGVSAKPADLLGSSGRFKPENATEAATVERLLKRGTDDADGLIGANGRYKPENAAEAQRVGELKAVFSHQANGKALVGQNDPNRLLGANGRFKPESDVELAEMQRLLDKGTADIARYRGPNGVWKAETPDELSRVLELKAVTSHLDNGGGRLLKAPGDATKLLGSSGRFKPENPEELAQVSTLLRKGTDDATSLLGANGRYKPENAAEATRVAELKAVFSHQANSTALTGPGDPRGLIGSSGRFKPENADEFATVQRLLSKGTDDLGQYRSGGRWIAETPAQLERVNELKAVLSHQASRGR